MSADFGFRLARILRHRRRMEDARALAVRQALERHASARARQASLELATELARSALTMDCSAGLSGAWLRLHAEAVRDLHGRARAAAILTAGEARRVDERRAELVEAARARRVLERLEEIRRTAWQAERARTDQRTTDEIAMTRHGRTS